MFKNFIQGLTIFALLLTVQSVQAGKFNSKLSIGDKAPGWSNLTGTDEKKHSLSDYKGADVVVVCFTRNLCPVAAAYSKRLQAFAEKYKGKKVALVAISVSYEGEEATSKSADKQIERNAKFASAQGWTFDYLYDHTQQTGKAYGATATPHVFVLDKNRKVAYMGAIDNNWSQAKGIETQTYMITSVDALLAGESVEEAETRPVGCRIQYRRSN